jgi:RNA recognition motif-containing protein
MSFQIYVGNISYGMREDTLKELFEQYGEVTSVNIVKDRMTGRSRGFGFVEMSDKDEAEKAIEALNGTDVDGRNIRVNVARSKRE